MNPHPFTGKQRSYQPHAHPNSNHHTAEPIKDKKKKKNEPVKNLRYRVATEGKIQASLLSHLHGRVREPG
jgi:hypothetical protein